jgi:hypothetical protein
MLVCRLADFIRRLAVLKKPVSKLKMAGFRRIFLHFYTSGKKKIKKIGQ